MKTTVTLATNLNISLFEIFDQDIDEVIMLINFYIDLGEEKEVKPSYGHKSDGFWDLN